MANQTRLKKVSKKFLIEERRRQVALLITQSVTEIEIAEKLGVDNSTISKDVKALKLISQQFIYDITKSDFTYYYKQCLDTSKLILKKQWEIVNKERITKEDIYRAKVLVDMLSTVGTINEYYKVAPDLHRSPIQKVLSEDRFGVRPGSKIHKLTKEEEEALLKGWEEDDAAEEAELRALEENCCSSPSSSSDSQSVSPAKYI
jgi:DNA-binding CsgD family transcriptional regulator